MLYVCIVSRYFTSALFLSGFTYISKYIFNLHIYRNDTNIEQDIMGLIIKKYQTLYTTCELVNTYAALVKITCEKNELSSWNITGYFNIYTSLELRHITEPIGHYTIRIKEVPRSTLNIADILFNRFKEAFSETVDEF